jgi:hypothetical protein
VEVAAAHPSKVSRAKTHKKNTCASRPHSAAYHLPKMSTLLKLVFALFFWFAANLFAETPAALAPRETSRGSDEELLKQLSNLISSLVSVPFQNNFDFGLGAGDGWRYS